MIRACLLIGVASTSAFSLSGVTPPRTAAARTGASPIMKSPYDLTGKVAFVAGVADSTGCAPAPFQRTEKQHLAP